jgi:hypothetical protein
VFSITDYPNFEGCNKAGVLTFGGKEVVATRFSSEEFDLSPIENFHYNVTSMENSLKDEIFYHKATIKIALLETSEDGRHVTVDQWVNVMKDVTGLDIEWASFQPTVFDKVLSNAILPPGHYCFSSATYQSSFLYFPPCRCKVGQQHRSKKRGWSKLIISSLILSKRP